MAGKKIILTGATGMVGGIALKRCRNAQGDLYRRRLKKKGAVLTRQQFREMMDAFYTRRGWDTETSAPGAEKLKRLGLAA